MVLLVLWLWVVWAGAQPAPTTAVATTNASSVTQTNQPGALAQGLARLEEAHLTFGLDRIALLRDNTVFGEPLWKYIASLIFIFLAFYVSKLLDFIVGVWLKRWAEKTETKFDDLLLTLLRGPVKAVAFVIFLHIGLSIFRWPSPVQTFLSKALIVIVACSITYVTMKVVDLLLGLWRHRAAAGTDKSFDEELFPVVSKSLKAFVIVVAVLVTSQNLGINITGVVASLSIGGLALGLAAQDTLANLFGAVAVYMDKPFRIGDRIRLENVDGTVEAIGLRSTRVRNLDGHLVTIPNKTMGNAIITNIARRPNIKTEMNIGLTYDTPAGRVQHATALLNEIFRAHPKTADLIITFNRFDSSSLNLQVIHWWDGTDFKAYNADLQALNLQIKERFDAEGLSFAFPTQTVYVKQE
jgi:MscS family membrane protein